MDHPNEPVHSRDTAGRVPEAAAETAAAHCRGGGGVGVLAVGAFGRLGGSLPRGPPHLRPPRGPRVPATLPALLRLGLRHWALPRQALLLRRRAPRPPARPQH